MHEDLGIAKRVVITERIKFISIIYKRLKRFQRLSHDINKLQSTGNCL